MTKLFLFARFVLFGRRRPVDGLSDHLRRDIGLPELGR